MSWKVCWFRVWNFCCPFIFANIVIWFWVLYTIPCKIQSEEIHYQYISENNKLRQENAKLKSNYKKLVLIAREKVHNLNGQNQQLGKQLETWQYKTVQLELKEAGFDTTPVSENWFPAEFLPLDSVKTLQPE